MITALSRTIEDGTWSFMALARPWSSSPCMWPSAPMRHGWCWACATYGIDPDPPLAPTTNDWVMDREHRPRSALRSFSDLAAAGRMGRMFLSGPQIDRQPQRHITWLSGVKDEAAWWRRLQPFLRCSPSHSFGPPPTGTEMLKAVAGSAWRTDCDFITNPGHRTKDGKLRRLFDIAATGRNGW